jgi:hypothetical protein
MQKDIIMIRLIESEWLFVRFIQGLFVLYAIYTVLIGDPVSSVLILFGLVLTMIPSFAEEKFCIALPLGLKSLIGFSLFLHVAGGLHMWYVDFYPYYDKIAHFISGMTVGLIIFLAFVLLNQKGVFTLNKRNVVGGILGLLLLLELIWEGAEWAFDELLKTDFWHGIIDTIFDISFSLIGAIAAVVIALGYLRYMPNIPIGKRYSQRDVFMP